MAEQREPWMRSEEDNLTSLPELNEENLIASIKKRYLQDRIYTDVGDILVAVNPFRMLPVYSETWSAAYARPETSKLMPHVYRVAARAFTAMVHSKRDQVCVISGESGAGKTESAKRIMQQASDLYCLKTHAKPVFPYTYILSLPILYNIYIFFFSFIS